MSEASSHRPREEAVEEVQPPAEPSPVASCDPSCEGSQREHGSPDPEGEMASGATAEPVHRSVSKAVTISEPNRSASPSPPPQPLTTTSSVAGSMAVTRDPLSQHRRSLEHAARKSAHVEQMQAEADRRRQAEETFRPYVSPYARQRLDRRMDDIILANEEWKRQRDMHIQKKRRQAKKEETAECAPQKHIDARSERLCLLKGYDRIDSTPRVQEERESRERRRLQLEQEMRPPFMPARYSHLSPGRDMSPDIAPAYIPERSRSAAAHRLHEESVARRTRHDQRRADHEAELEAQDRQTMRARSAATLRRNPAVARRIAERLEEWKRQRDARLHLRCEENKNDPEATFHPSVSRRSAELAAVHRTIRGTTYQAETTCVAAHVRPKHVVGVKPRTNVVKCAPLPASFWTRNQRHHVAKQQRAAQVREQIDSRNKEHCTFAPKISAVSDAIMQQLHTIQPKRASEPTFMQPTESTVRHAAEVSHPVPEQKQPPPPRRSATAEIMIAPERKEQPRPAAPAQHAPNPKSTSAAPPTDNSSLDSRMAELRATLDQWNQLAGA